MNYKTHSESGHLLTGHKSRTGSDQRSITAGACGLAHFSRSVPAKKDTAHICTLQILHMEDRSCLHWWKAFFVYKIWLRFLRFDKAQAV